MRSQDQFGGDPEPDRPLLASVEAVANLYQGPPLRIPDYQRPYTWTEKNVDLLVHDIRQFQPAGEYRIGTFILHRSGGESKALDIVDGQQRYLTFALIAHALLASPSDLTGRIPSGLAEALPRIEIPERNDGRSEQNLRANYAYLRRAINGWSPGEREDFAEFFFNDCTVVVLQVPDLDGAFQMFDSQNTRGRALYPTDLLKAYHLREFSQTGPSHDTLVGTVRAWEAIPPEEINHVISGVLFPIKRWSLNHRLPSDGFTARHVDLFKGVREGRHGNGHFRWAQPVLWAKAAVDRFSAENDTLIRHQVVQGARYPFQITQPVIDGEMFFVMVDHYVREARRAGISGRHDSAVKGTREHQDPELADLLDNLGQMPPGTGNRYVRELFDCLLMAYLDRFGWHQVRAAARTLAQYAYLLRLHLQRVQLSSVDIHARNGHHRIGGATGNLFAEITQALDPRDILTRDYPGITAEVTVPEPLRGLYDDADPGPRARHPQAVREEVLA